MSLGLRLPLLAVLIAGCASQVLMVPDADWQTVPPAQRASVDRQHEVDLAAARSELAAASASLAEFKRAPTGPAAQRPTTIAAPADADDEWAAAMRDHERTRGDAFNRVEAAKADWLRTDLAWRELRLETAKARLEMVVCERELLRAQTIDHSLPGNDHYDTAPLRGQFSRAQQRWHAVASNARQARIAFERAGTTLASSKEAYAQLMRNGPAQLPVPPRAEPDERPTRLDLSGWAITRGDISRRRGLRHALDNAAYPPPQLRKSAYKLSPTPRTPLPATAAMPPTAPRPGVQVPRAKPTTADSMKPWDLVEPTARTAAAKPAPRAVAPAPVTAPAVAPATAAVKPPAEAPITAAKPVAQPRAKPQSVPGKAIRTRKPSAPPTTRMIGPELPPGGLTTTKAPRTFGPELPPGGLTKKPPQR